MSELSLAARRTRRATGLVPRRPLELAEETFEFVRLHTRQLAVLVAIVVLPVQLLVAYLSRAAFAGQASAVFAIGGTRTTTADLGPFNLLAGATTLGDMLTFLTLSLVAGPVARMVAAFKTGREVSLRQAARLPMRTWLSLVAACALVHVCEFAGALALLVGSLFAMVVFSVASPVVALEDAGPFRALGRSWRLCLRRFGPVLGVVCAMTLVTMLFSEAIGSLPTVLPEFVGFTGGWLLAGVGMVSAKMVSFAVTASFAAMLYVDLRVWTEGMDIAVALAPGGTGQQA